MITNSLNEQQRTDMEALWNNHKLLKLMGCKVDLSHDDYILVGLEVGENHRGGLGTQAVNGAVMASLFDLLTGLVGIVNSDQYRTGTVNLNINYLKPLRGNRLYGKAYLLKKGQSLVFVRSELHDENDIVCATCEGMCSVDRSKPKVENYLVI